MNKRDAFAEGPLCLEKLLLGGCGRQFGMGEAVMGIRERERFGRSNRKRKEERGVTILWKFY